MKNKDQHLKDIIFYITEILHQSISFGSVIQQIQQHDKFSNLELASLLGISAGYLSSIKNGKRHASPKLAKKLAEKLGYSKLEFIQLVLQDQLNKIGLNFLVILKKEKVDGIFNEK